jgi:hypothetical protein
MTYLAMYVFYYFSRSLESCSSASSEVILKFSTDLKSPVHARFTIYYDKFSFTKSSGLKSHAVLLTEPIFAGFCVCHTDLGGEGQ